MLDCGTSFVLVRCFGLLIGVLAECCRHENEEACDECHGDREQEAKPDEAAGGYSEVAGPVDLLAQALVARARVGGIIRHAQWLAAGLVAPVYVEGEALDIDCVYVCYGVVAGKLAAKRERRSIHGRL